MHGQVLEIAEVIALGLVIFLIVLVLFEPGLKYKIKPRPLATDGPEFAKMLAALCDAEAHTMRAVEVLDNGDQFYPAELAAIAGARHTVHLESYIFQKGEIATRIVEALTERAKAGVKVKVVIDSVGSFMTPDKLFDALRAAGGRVEWYQPLKWYTFKRWNNRTHRKLLVVDGTVAFAGGADVGDDWLKGSHDDPKWRDTVFRFEGQIVTGLQSTFAENWLEASEEILADDDYFPLTRDADPGADDGAVGMVVNSTPSAARGSRARILYQTIMAYAGRSIRITTPYFLPDRSSLCEIVTAAKDRGVKVTLLTPGKHSDHLMTRSSARRRYGDLLKAGVEVYEYRPSMIHTKTLVVDGLWSIVGSTNFDNRSFGLNDEVNVAVRDAKLAGRLEEDFCRDLENSRRITLEDWKNRPLREKLFEHLFRIFDRQF